ncbi:MAG: S16 family serine protease [Actinomycetota bacterium]
MTEGSVPLPPPVLPASVRGTQTRFAAAVSMITVSWLVLAVVLVMATVRVQRWEVAPGEAMAVSPRISFEVEEGKESDPPQRHPARNSIRFVTAFGGQLSALDAVLGWIDPHVQVDTFEEHFGGQTPATSRQLGFQSMFGAKQVAEYVAMKRIGLDARFTDGKIIVNELVCAEEPAARSACRVLTVGDTIVRFDGVEVPTLAELATEMKDRKAGEEVSLTVVPHGKDPDDASAREERRVVLMANPDEPARAIIGIIPADTRTVQLPFEVAISTADIGGPSAGLAFTLGLLDDLTEGNLMGRGRVAATGTMSPDEKVGAIGALRQKAVAVRDAGVTLFLVPAGQSAGELSAARAAAGRGVTIVPVATLQEALEALAANGGDPLPRP